jgi:hypothetical protein
LAFFFDLARAENPKKSVFHPKTPKKSWKTHVNNAKKGYLEETEENPMENKTLPQ